MKNKYLNDEVISLLVEHDLRQSELARRIKVSPKLISNICRKNRNLGEQLFIKILSKGFGCSLVETEKVFLKAMKGKYL